MKNLSVEVKIADTDLLNTFINLFNGLLAIFNDTLNDDRIPLEVKNEAKEKFNKLSQKYNLIKNEAKVPPPRPQLSEPRTIGK